MSQDLKELLLRGAWFLAGLGCAVVFCIMIMLLFTADSPAILRVGFLLAAIFLVHPCVYSFRRCMQSTEKW
jgi:hypothetical protein